MYFVVTVIYFVLILEILFFVKMRPIGEGLRAARHFGFYDGVARTLA